MNDLKINGHSGCHLSIFENDGQLFVKKWSDASYTPRLRKQHNKQLFFSDETHIFDDINVKVPSPVFDDESGIMTMDYISGDSFVEYFEKASKDDIFEFEQTLFNIISKELKHSRIQEVDKSVFTTKIDSVKEKVLEKHPDDADIFEPVEKFINKNNVIQIPVGICHGDLTFSNMIFTDKNVWLIDFLDSFIDTPLQDIAKIRQDTCFHWSLRMLNGTQSFNSVHVKTVMKHIDEFIDSSFKNKQWYACYYNFFQYVNLLRILPYANDVTYNDVKKMLNEIDL